MVPPAPSDWHGASHIEFIVTGQGDWSRLLKRPMSIGEYSTEQLDYSLWATAPTHSRTTIGDPNQGLSGGTEAVRNDSTFSFQLAQAGAPLANISCRQTLDVSGLFIAHAEDAFERFEVSANERYAAELVCHADAIAPRWQPWDLHLVARNGRPYFGVLRRGPLSYSVIGTDETQHGPMQETTGFYLRQQDKTQAFVHRVGGSSVQLRPDVETDAQTALIAAAMVLLLANDPVAAE